MATYITPRHQATRPAAGSSSDAAHVRRPQPGQAEPLLEPGHAADVSNLLDDAALPPTVLRLPDLAVAAKSLPAWHNKLKLATIAQWVAIALGAVLALWLIFGGRAPAQQVDEAPVWSAPGPAHAAAAPPTWNGPGSAQAAAHVPAPAAPQAALAPAEAPATENPTADHPAATTPTKTPPFDPYHQLQDENGSDAAGPPASDAARQAPLPNDAVAPREPIHTAMRPDGAAETDRYQPSEAQPLNVTVPVPQ